MKKRISGFSLLELMATIAVTGIALTLAIPGFESLVNKVKVDTQITQLVESFTLARHYAVNSSTHVTVCGSDTGNSCNGAWDKGILAYSHKSETSEPGQNNVTRLYHHLIDNTFTARGNIRKFTFRPSGLLRGRSGSLLYCPPVDPAKNLRRIVVSKGGRIRTYTPTELATIHYLSTMQCS
ncbi:MAG: hypothetical protein CSA49_00300 [Gammaproteobacteria bacterium]|nr:MAG: hypothetical protein CSA49_00300 [Gammaproteobacteria bacterium]